MDTNTQEKIALTLVALSLLWVLLVFFKKNLRQPLARLLLQAGHIKAAMLFYHGYRGAKKSKKPENGKN